MADTVTPEDVHELAQLLHRRGMDTMDSAEANAVHDVADVIENWALDLAQRESTP